MTTYRQVKGYSIKSVSTDPSNTKEGQIWYNNTLKQIKVSPLLGAWSSGGALGTKHNGAMEAGTQTAALVAGGNDGDSNPPHVYSTPNTEEYNGSSWAEQNNMSTGRFNGCGSGSQTAALAFGGNKYPGYAVETEEYDGTSWTNGGNLNIGKSAAGGGGTQTAAVFCGGYYAPAGSTAQTSTEHYDGSSWTTVNNMNNGRKERPGLFGLQTAAVVMGGTGTGTSTVAESYDGTNWASANSMTEEHTGMGACGSQSDGMGFGGGTPNQSVERYDGTSFSSIAALATGRAYCNGLGSPSTVAAGLASAGDPTRQATEEFTEAVTTRSVDVS